MLKQLTFGNYGHTLNRRQSLSADGRWAVYDTRNDDSQIAQTDAIEMVCIDSGEVVRLYQTTTKSMHGPGVGAVAFHPIDDKIVFIHGLESCSAKFPYSASRRFGAILEMGQSLARPRSLGYVHAESRNVNEADPEVYYGTLSGGTHAHSWNREGWISFTYNDALLEIEAKELATTPGVRDLRTVGFMIPKQESGSLSLDVSTTANSENWLGTYDAFLAATVCNEPKPGSDQIEQAVEECWAGNQRRIAFQGTVRTRSNESIPEVFVVDLPSGESLRGSKSERRANRLACVPGCVQRRLTYTQDRRYPGIQGPRSWLVASPDGETVYFPMKDAAGVSQVFRVAVNSVDRGGDVHQVSHLTTPIDGQISLNADGSKCAFLSNQRVCLLDLASGKHQWVTDRMISDRKSLEWIGAVQFATDESLIGNAYVKSDTGRFLQVFAIKVD
jgi:hypothetical protein